MNLKLAATLALALSLHAQQPGIRSGTASPGTVNLGSNPITESWTVGTGGVTANKLVQTDTSAPLKIVDATTGVYGVAMTTVSAAGTVEVARYGTVPCVTDTGGGTAGNLVILGTGTTDTCKDSGQTASSAIATTVRIIGVFRATATAGNTALVELTPSHFGTQSAGGGGSSISPTFWFPDGYPGYNNANKQSLSPNLANSGARTPLTLQTGISTAHIYVEVGTADAGKFGSIAIYNSAMTPKYCETTPFSIGATGVVTASWASPPCVLTAGAYYVVTTADSATGAIQQRFNQSFAPLESVLSPGAIGYATTGCVSTGSGSSIAFVSSPSCTWAANTLITPFIYAVGQ